MSKIITTALNLALVLLSGMGCGYAHAAGVSFKLATLAPEGSSWMNIIKAATVEIQDKTAGRVEFKLYPGGIAGDEPDVLRKMRVGQYHAAGFTGVGLGELVSELRALELPLYYDSLDELHYVRDQLTPYFEEKLKGKGYIFMGWAEPGLVYVLAQKPIKNVADMRGVKMWAWEGDPLAEALMQTFNVTPVRVSLPDVLMGLQTGMISAVYAPPLAAMALQWQTKVKYMTDEPLTNSIGAVLLSKAQWDKIAPADQALVRQSMAKHLKELNDITIKQNNEAIEKFKQQGIKIEPPSKEGRAEMFAAAEKIRGELVGKLYDAAFLKKVEGYVQAFRALKNKKPGLKNSSSLHPGR